MTAIITIIRILALLPLVLFIVQQLRKNTLYESILVKKVRRITLLMCVGNVILLTQIIYSRIVYLSNNPASDLISFVVSSIILILNWWAFTEILNIQKSLK